MTTTPEKGLDFKKLLPILVIVLVDVLGLTIIIPILPFYALAFDAGPTLIGLLGTSYPLMQFLFVPVLGALSDRHGRKPVLAAAQVGTFLSLLILGFAGSLWMLFVSRIVDGITGANLATAQAVITDSTPPSERARGLGLIGATFGVGFVIGPALSGLALRLSGNNYGAPAFLAAGFALLSVLLTFFMLPETLPVEKRGQGPVRRRNFGRMAQALRDPRFGFLFIFIFGLQVIFGAFQLSFAPFTLNRLGLNSLGNTIFFALFGVVIVLVQGGLIGPLSKKFGERRLVLAGLFFFSLGFILASFTPQQPVPWYSRAELIDELASQSSAAAAGSATQINLLPREGAAPGWFALIYTLLAILPVPIGSGLIQPNIQSLVTRRADPQKIGEALGLAASFTALGTATGPITGGLLFDLLGPNGLYFGCGAAAALLLFLTNRHLGGSPEKRVVSMAGGSED